MNKEREEYFTGHMIELDKIQQRMLEYDKKLIQKEKSGENPIVYRTIAEQEKLLFEKVNAKKIDLDYFHSHLNDIFDYKSPIDYFEIAPPCKIIEFITEMIIPEEYFYSFYHIPLEEKDKRCWGYNKELIFFVTSRDGKNVYIADFLNAGIINENEYLVELYKTLCYLLPGIATCEDDMELVTK